MALIQGQTVTLYDRIQTGADALNAPIYQETAVEIPNVLICPVSTQEILTDTQPQGKAAVYELCIPKEDTHTWENREVEFYGRRWYTSGFVLTWDSQLTPGPWNKKVRVESYG